MSKFKEAVGKLELEVGGIAFSFVPEVDDSFDFLELYKEGVENKDLVRRFHPWLVSFVNRYEKLEEGSEEYEDLRKFLAVNIMKFFIEFGVAFRLFEREDLERRAKDFQGAQARN